MKKIIKKYWKLFLIIGILGISVILCLYTVHTINNNTTFKLIGEDNITIKLNEEYNDEGVTATVFDKDISKNMTTNNNIDNTKTGEQTIEYDLNFLGKEYHLQRKVTVIDDEKPVITLNGESEISIFAGESYEDEGATASDNYDGDITDKIEVLNDIDNNTAGEYEIVYSVTDSSGNKSSEIRKVIIKEKPKPVVPKYTPPVYTYDGDDPIAKMIIEHGYRVSVGYYNLVTGKTYYYNRDKIYFGASLIKTIDALYLYENNLVTDEIRPYIQRAISVSDNDAHRYLVDYIGRNNLRNYGVSLGADLTLSGGTYFGNTNVDNQLAYYKKLYELTRDNSELASFFTNDYVNSLRFSQDIGIMHKYGWSGSAYHDAGIFLTDEPYILVVLTEHGDYGREPINNISKLIYKYHKGEL